MFGLLALLWALAFTGYRRSAGHRLTQGESALFFFIVGCGVCADIVGGCNG